jgi:hypothetical protein
MSALPHAKRPCGACPWRVDVDPGEFPPDRYACLARTSADQRTGASASVEAPMFACHLSPDGKERACAGWLAVEGAGHVGVRLAVVTGRLPSTTLRPGKGWPELHPDYATLAAINGLGEIP